MNDYRNSAYCPVLTDISNKKNNLKEEILKVHPDATNFYNYIRNNDDKYKSEFGNIFNGKCAYCGQSLDISGITTFEIDHYICSSSKNFSDEFKNDVNNLVFSCRMCNRKKGSLEIKGEYIKVLNPEDGSIAKVFYRDEDFYIKIVDAYINDSFVNKFYNTLGLNYEIKRLDYLLLMMYGLYYKLDSENSYRTKLNECITLLQKKRNLII